MTSDGERATIEVIDNGPGLPKQNRSKLLEPYVTTKGRKGTGLGLAIVQKIVEQHGGTLTLDDAPTGTGPNPEQWADRRPHFHHTTSRSRRDRRTTRPRRRSSR